MFRRKNFAGNNAAKRAFRGGLAKIASKNTQELLAAAKRPPLKHIYEKIYKKKKLVSEAENRKPLLKLTVLEAARNLAILEAETENGL